MSEEFIKKHKEKINFHEIYKNKKIKISILKKFKDKFNYEKLYSSKREEEKTLFVGLNKSRYNNRNNDYLKMYKILGKELTLTSQEYSRDIEVMMEFNIDIQKAKYQNKGIEYFQRINKKYIKSKEFKTKRLKRENRKKIKEKNQINDNETIIF